MFSSDPFSTIAFAGDSEFSSSNLPNPPSPVIYFNNNTLTFPLRINRVASFTLEKINSNLEFSLNRNSLVELDLSINKISENDLNINTMLTFAVRR